MAEQVTNTRGALINELQWCRDNYGTSRTKTAIDQAIEILSIPAGDGHVLVERSKLEELARLTNFNTSALAAHISAWATYLLAAPRQPGEVGAGVPNGWVPLTLEFDQDGAEDVAYGPKRMMDRLGKWLTTYFEWRIAEKARVDASAQQDEHEAEAWLMELCSAWDFGIPGAAFGDIVRRIAAAQQVQADAGAVAYIPNDALARLTPPLLVLDGVRLYRYNAVGTTALYTHPAAESDKRDSERLNWLQSKGKYHGFESFGGEQFQVFFDDPTYDIRKDIDAAMSREQSGGDRG